MDLKGLEALWLYHRHARPKEGGRRRWGALILGGILVLYLGFAAFTGGMWLGRHLLELSPGGAGVLLWRIPLGLGVAGALWDGGCLVDPTPFRPFFIQDSTLVFAEAGLGLSTPVKRVLLGVGGVFSLGLAWAHAVLLPWGLFYTLLAVFWVVCLERIIHVMVPVRLLRQRTLLLLGSLWVAILVGLRYLEGQSGLSSWGGLRPLNGLWSQPGEALLRTWKLSLAGHSLQAVGGLALPLLLTAGLALLAWSCVYRAFQAGRADSQGVGAGHVWAFRRPLFGVAWMQFHMLLGSRSGQLRLFMLLLSILMIKEPELITVGHLQTPQLWSVGAGAFIFGMTLINPLGNLLGFDRGGVRTWWVLPLRGRDLWLGKILGTAAYGALAAPILLALLWHAQALRFRAIERARQVDLRFEAGLHPFGGGQMLALAVFLGILFLWWAASAFQRSLSGATPMDLGTYGVRFEFDDEKVARLWTVLEPLFWMIPLFGLASWLGLRVVFPLLGGLAVVAGWRFSRKLGEAEVALEACRETLTEKLQASRGGAA